MFIYLFKKSEEYTIFNTTMRVALNVPNLISLNVRALGFGDTWTTVSLSCEQCQPHVTLSEAISVTINRDVES